METILKSRRLGNLSFPHPIEEGIGALQSKPMMKNTKTGPIWIRSAIAGIGLRLGEHAGSPGGCGLGVLKTLRVLPPERAGL